MNTLAYGYTTGTCAAAASKAALLGLLGDSDISRVDVQLPSGQNIVIPIKLVEVKGNQAWAEVVKYAGDDPDVTDGMSIISRVLLLDTPGIILAAGEGVGKVTKPGLSVGVGQPAINPVPRKMIETALMQHLPPGRGVHVTISAPEGEIVARRTMNARLGIMGGISILGTTGIVRPMSKEAYIDSLVPQIHQAIALGYRTVVLTPGGMGQRMAQDRGVDADAIAQTSNFIGAMIEECTSAGVEAILIFGHIGKIIKVAGGIFNTHSKVADARREILAAHLALMGAPKRLIEQIMELNTIDESVQLLKKHQMQQVYTHIASAATRCCQVIAGENIRVGTVVYALDGSILGWDQNAEEMGKRAGWNMI